MNKIYTLLSAAALTLSAWAGEPTMTPANGYPSFAMGGDLSWTSRIQDAGTPTYYLGNTITADQITTIPDMVLDHGFDAVRLRVWVDPEANALIQGSWEFKVSSNTYVCTGTYGYCGTDDLIALATTFANKGARIMVAFHLSDTFADPARQFIPKAWEDCTDIDDLASRAGTYVKEVLQKLYDANVNVAWVQIGNETSTGMLKYKLPTSNKQTVTMAALNCEIKSSNATTTKNFVKVFGACAEASKSVYPEAKTLIHLADGPKWNNIKWAISTLESQGFGPEMCDLVGLSLYPCVEQNTTTWKAATDDCISAIKNIATELGYNSIICEIGMNNEWTAALPNGTQAQGIAQCNKDVTEFTQYLVDNLKGTNCEGFFYWEPETDYLDGYTMGACVSANPGSSWPRNKVTANDYWTTVKANSSFPDGGLVSYEHAGINDIINDESKGAVRFYNLQGVEVKNPTKGIYIRHQGARATKIAL